MKRDAAGRFVNHWHSETKHRVSVSLTRTAWRSLDKEAQKRGISRSEVIERFARSLEEDASDQTVPASERKVEMILESITDAFVAFDQDWHYTYINQAAARILHKTPAELIGKHVWHDVFPELVGGVAYQAIHRAVAEQVPISWEEFGEPIQCWVEVHAYPSPAGVAVYFRDVTERKQAEAERERLLQELATERAQFETVLQQMPAGVLIADAASGKLVLANQQARQIIGYDYEQSYELEDYASITPFAAFRPDGQIYAPDEYPLARSLKTGEIITNEEIELRQEDGRRTVIVVNSTPILGKQEQILAAVVVFQDITERKQTETLLRQQTEALENQQKWLETVLDLMPTPLVFVEPGTAKVIFSNRIANQLTGGDLPTNKSLDEYAYYCVDANGDRIPPESMPAVLIAQGERLENYEINWYTPGSIRSTLCWGETLPAMHGHPAIGIGMFQDVTRLKQIEENLRQTEERLQLALTSAQMVAWDMDLSTNQVVCSPNAVEIWGIHRGSAEDFHAVIHPDDRQQVKQATERAVDGDRSFSYEYRVIDPDGVTRWLKSQGRVYLDETGRAIRMAGVSLNVSERKHIEAEREALLKELQRKERQQQFLIELNDTIRAIQDSKEIMWYVVSSTGQHFHVTRCTYGEIDATQEYVIVDRDYCNGVMSIVGSHHMNSFGSEILAELKQGKTIVVNDVDRDPRTAGSGAAAFTAIQTKSLLCVPLVKAGQFVALLVLHHVAPRAWTAEEVVLMERISEKTWLAVERSRAEEKLRDSEAHLQLAVRIGRMGTWDWDVQTGAMFWSEGHFAMLGLQPSECEPSYEVWANHIHPQDRPETEAKLQRAMREHTEYHHEYRLLCPDGSIHWAEARGQFTYDSQGHPKYSIGVVIDVSERKQTEQEREQLLQRERIARSQAEAANRVKDEFLAVLSHELRSPLNPILGWTKILRSRQLDAAKTEQALETIERNAKLQAQLIEDLLDISRILQGKMTLNVAPVNLAATIEAALETVHLAAEAKQIQIQTTLNPVGETVSGDTNRLQQVVWNLLSNAIKFTPVGGRVEVRLESFEFSVLSSQFEESTQNSKLTTQNFQSYAQITVSDTGKGISPDFLPHVFDYFRQEDGTTTRRFGGLGLGLAIVRQLSELHGGTVSAESPGQNLGATFTVRLPLQRAKQEQSAQVQPLATAIDLTDVQILVVDDDADMRELATFVLTQSSAKVMTAASAIQALSLLNQSVPDLLLCDIGMPEMDGYSLMRQIRKLAPQQSGTIPAIALTAYAGEMNQQQALAAGFQMHISKPVEPERLVQAIARLLHLQP